MVRLGALAVLVACSNPPASDPDAAIDSPGPLAITTSGAFTVAENELLAIAVETTGGVRAPHVFVENLPPGATWFEQTLRFSPDFIQGGHAWQVTITADDGETRVQQTLDIAALDTITPIAPTITTMTAVGSYTRLAVAQTTDDFLDSPGRMGRSFAATVSVPTVALGTTTMKFPVRISLHGFGAAAPGTGGSANEIRIYPHDPDNTYWWGYATTLPPVSGEVPEYTARRVLNLLGWVLATYPAADPARVIIDGGSMGGAGAMTIGLLHARHFAHVDAMWGQAIPKNHRPSRVAQLRTLWGTPELDLGGVWTQMDLTRALRDDSEARDQFLSLKHSKDDGTIHFGAVTMPSPTTQQSFYASLRDNHVGHHAIWDEGGHGENDPVLGGSWWTNWNPLTDATAFLRRDRAFPAFSGASIDRDPGTGAGNGTRAFNAESGYAGSVAVVGDTGWDGERAGGINRFLRWDASMIVDTLDRFELPLRVIDGTGGAAPRDGDPTTGDRLDGTPPVTCDVTPRRVQAFRTAPGESIAWTFGTQSGTAIADATGAVTIPALSLGLAWTTLVLTRSGE